MKFKYEAMDKTGLEVADEIEAESIIEAQAQIRQQGFFVTKITQNPKIKPKNKKWHLDQQNIFGILCWAICILFASLFLYWLFFGPKSTEPTPNPFRPMIIQEKITPQVIEYQGHTFIHDPNCKCKK